MKDLSVDSPRKNIMARMYPQHFPKWADDDPKRSAEKKVYNALASLPDPYTVFYSVAWQLRGSKSGARDGEADFVIAHPEKGILVLEVKGGQIRYDANLQQWYSRDCQDIEHEIKDPIFQARNNKWALLSKLKEMPSWDNRFVTIGHLIVFPDVIANSTSLRPDLPHQLLVDSNDLKNIEAKIEEGFDWFFGEDKKQGALGNDRLRVLSSILGHSFSLPTPLGIDLEGQDQKIVELTEQQMCFLQFIQHHRRALIEGCAGSGKTMLALEKARQLSEQGFETLLVCFNRPLAEHLREKAPQEVDIYHFHGLCIDLAKKAGLGYQPYTDKEEFYNKILPESLRKAIEILGTQYDAIIVDEGQDFHKEWLETLMFALHNSEQGIFYVFYDNNQNIYRRAQDLQALLKVSPFVLNRNCRNTRAIHNVVKEFHNNPNDLVCIGPDGQSPELYFFSNPSQQEDIVRRVLDELVNTGKIEPKYITLLTTRAPEHTVFGPGRKLGKFIFREWGDKDFCSSDIYVSSVHRFKGLENRVIILTGLEDNDATWLNEILYVACSRARTHLIIVAHERSKDLLAKALPSPK